MNVVALTPTGNRPEGLALLGEYLNAQTYDGPMTWIVVDDCDPETRVPAVRDGIEIYIVRPPWRWRPGMNTQARALRAGLEMVPETSALFVLEDDDIYLPMTLLDGLRALQTHDLVGERTSRYYNVSSRRWRALRGKIHASLASTAMKGAAIEHFRAICSNGQKTMLDVNLWKSFDGSKRLLDSANVVGIKGLPGRPGIGIGHRRRFGAPDDGSKLREWAGDYAAYYDIFKEAA